MISGNFSSGEDMLISLVKRSVLIKSISFAISVQNFRLFTIQSLEQTASRGVCLLSAVKILSDLKPYLMDTAQLNQLSACYESRLHVVSERERVVTIKSCLAERCRAVEK